MSREEINNQTHFHLIHLNGRSSTFPFDSSPVPIFSDYIEDKLATNYTVTHIINLGFLHEF